MSKIIKWEDLSSSTKRFRTVLPDGIELKAQFNVWQLERNGEWTVSTIDPIKHFRDKKFKTCEEAKEAVESFIEGWFLKVAEIIKS